MGKVRPENHSIKGPGKVEPKDGISNKEYSKSDKWFREACDLLDIPEKSRPRQASKYRNKKGLVYNTFKNKGKN